MARWNAVAQNLILVERGERTSLEGTFHAGTLSLKKGRWNAATVA